jgi:hypothetical protein
MAIDSSTKTNQKQRLGRLITDHAVALESIQSKLIAVCSEKCLTWSNSSFLLAVLCVVRTQEV